MNHHGTRKIVKLLASGGLDPSLHTKVLVPCDALKDGIDKSHDARRGDELRPKLGALGNATRYDGRNGCSKGQQKEKFDQIVAIFSGQLFRTHKEIGAIRNAVTHDKINHCRDREVDQDFDQGINLVFLANGAQLQKGKSRVHGQHHDAA